VRWSRAVAPASAKPSRIVWLVRGAGGRPWPQRRTGERVAAAIRASGAEAHVAVGDLARARPGRVRGGCHLRRIGRRRHPGQQRRWRIFRRWHGAWMDATDEDWIKAYQGNVVCAVRMIRRFTPGMKASGWGRVIQISSIVGHTPSVVIPDYAASKAALLNLTVSLSKALGNTGITVNSISPGLILTPAVDGWLRGLAPKFGWATTGPRSSGARSRNSCPTIAAGSDAGRHRARRILSGEPASRLRHRHRHAGDRRLTPRR